MNYWIDQDSSDGPLRWDVMERMIHSGLSTDKDSDDYSYQGGVPFWTWYCFMAYLLDAVRLQFAPKGVQTDFQQSC